MHLNHTGPDAVEAFEGRRQSSRRAVGLAEAEDRGVGGGDAVARTYSRSETAMDLGTILEAGKSKDC
jgi:hypothetical protein